MDTVYLVTRPGGKKKCYDFMSTLEKKEGFKKGYIKEKQLPYKEAGFEIEKIDHDSRI